MSGVFRNIDHPPFTARRVCTPPLLARGDDTLAGWRGGGGSIVRKTPDTALHSIYVSTLCFIHTSTHTVQLKRQLLGGPSFLAGFNRHLRPPLPPPDCLSPIQPLYTMREGKYGLSSPERRKIEDRP
jgi:hypothetical protein